METMKVRIEGLGALLCHNPQAIDKQNHFAKAISAISKKRAKTEADMEEMSHLEFLCGLYMSHVEGNGDSMVPVLPLHMLRSMIVAGAKKDKNGPLAKAGVFVNKHAAIEYDGPKDPDELYAVMNEDGTRKFVSRVPVAVQRNKVIRTRPIFNPWALVVELDYLPEVIDGATIMQAFNRAGLLCGLGDWRDLHGKFTATLISDTGNGKTKAKKAKTKTKKKGD
jgi:hypothetical protein